ncbi:MAG: universal stress protein [Methylibium sp.]|nr:universal stress protein [Methylibium sp.]
MNYRSLLVLLDGKPRCDARVDLAACFAVAHGSHLIGVAPTGVIGLGSGLGAAARYVEDAARARSDAIDHAGRWADRFQARCRAAGVASLEADAHEGDPLVAVLHHAHCADVAVIGQADPASPAYRDEQRFVEQVLLHSARPTLIVPCSGHIDTVGGEVLVAWDDSHGSARATADALPLLQQARQVHLRSWRRATEATEEAIRGRLQAVQRWLMRQGVACNAQVKVAPAAIGDAILDDAAALGADLIVMGTYGHSRWTERMLGGATRTALERSKVTLLMSH